MNPLHKALYRDFFKNEPDERQEGIINAELARCLISIFWLNSALFILKTAHDRLEGVFMSGMTAILFLNLIFISVFIFTNSASRELQKQKPDITPQNLAQHLAYHQKWAVLLGVFFVVIISALCFNSLAFAIYPLPSTILFLYSYGLFLGLTYYRRSKKEALKILATKQAETAESETDKEA